MFHIPWHFRVDKTSLLLFGTLVSLDEDVSHCCSREAFAYGLDEGVTRSDYGYDAEVGGVGLETRGGTAGGLDCGWVVGGEFGNGVFGKDAHGAFGVEYEFGGGGVDVSKFGNEAEESLRWTNDQIGM